MKYLDKAVEGFFLGVGLSIAWRITGAILSFLAGAHGPTP